MTPRTAPDPEKELLVRISIYAAFMMVITVFVFACSYWWEQNHVPENLDPTCEMAEEHLVSMDCMGTLIVPGTDMILGTEDDLTFSEFCTIIEMSGVMKIDLHCVMMATDCRKVEGCLNVN